MSLSTFSAHVRNIVAILGAATSRSLVLLDELAAGHRPGRGLVARAGAARAARAAGAADGRDDPLPGAEGMGERDRRRRRTPRPASTRRRAAPLYRIALGRAGISHALRTAERLGLDPAVVEAARARVDPARLRTAELLAEAEEAERQAAEERELARGSRAEAETAVARAAEREAELAAEIERVRASAEARAGGRARRGRARARRRPRRAGGTAQGDPRSPADASASGARPAQVPRRAERDRRLGAASERADRAERALRSFRPPPQTAPLAAGDPVEAADSGARGHDRVDPGRHGRGASARTASA